MEINKYPDGTSYVNGTGIGVEGSIIRINSYQELWYLNQSIDAYRDKYNNHIPTITIPNLIDAQADRRFNKGESSGLKLVCKFLNSLDAKFKIFHPHNPEVVEAMMDNVEIIDNTKFIERVMQNVSILKENLILVSSDAGGFKPLMKLCDDIKWGGQIHSCSKGRSYDGNKSTLTQRIGKDNFYGKDILIIDDISVYGGTFKGLSKLLRQRNCGKLYLAVSHMTVQNLGEDPVTNYFDKVFTTNSKFDSYQSGEQIINPTANNYKMKNLEIIKIF